MIAIRQRVLAMDVMRALAIITVIFIHVTALMLSYSTVNTKIYMQSLLVNQLARFSVPAFITLSGIGLSISYKEGQGYFKFLAHRLYKVIPRYIIWCVIYIYIIKKTLNISLIANNILYGSAFYHLYFVPLIIQFYIIFPLVHKIIGSKLSLIINFIITMLILVGVHNYIFPGIIQNFFDRKNMLDWLFYFSFGAFIGNNLTAFLNLLKKFRKIVFVSFILVIFGFIYEIVLNARFNRNIDYSTTFLRPSILIYSTVVILLIFSINWKENFFMRIVQYISKSSYGVFLSHALVLYYFSKYYTDNMMNINSIGFLIKGFFITFFGGIIINQIRKFP